MVIGIAILRHRLFEIDIVIQRTLVYGVLTVLIVVIYIAIVGILGAIFHTQTNTISGLVATAVIAVLFQPVRNYLQRAANRLLYGERDDPTAVLTQLAQQVETADTPAAILPNLVQTIAYTLKIPHVAIWLPTHEDRFEPVAFWGQSPESVEILPLTYQLEEIGQLVVAPRSADEQFDSRERELLNGIAALTAKTGIAAFAVKTDAPASLTTLTTSTGSIDTIGIRSQCGNIDFVKNRYSPTCTTVAGTTPHIVMPSR